LTVVARGRNVLRVTTTMTQAVPFLDLAAQHSAIGADLARAVTKVLQTQQFILGNEGKSLEAECAAYTKAKHAIGCASGSDALLLALRALDVAHGDCVVTTPQSFFATVGAPARLDARVDFVDVEPGTVNLDPAKLEAFFARCTRDRHGDLREPRQNTRVRAVIAVDLFGRPCRWEQLEALCSKHRVALIDDAAQAFGASVNGRRCGVFGDMTTFSFYPTKNLGGAGDGGMLSTNDDALAARIRALRVHGNDGKKGRYYHQEVGWNSRLDEMQAAVLRVKLPHLDAWNAARREHAKAYDEALSRVPGLRPLERPAAGVEAIYHLYVVRAERRDALQAHLTKAGIGCGVYYPLPLHLQECFAYLGYRKGDLPIAEGLSDEVIALPMYAELPVDARARVIDEVRRFYGA
jgi:dTDP-4-amino-4,6-dideoxygalactose transaminase